MTQWFGGWWEGSAESVNHSHAITTDLPAGSTLCYIEATVLIGLASNGISNTADVFQFISDGMAIGAVATGAGSPNFDDFLSDDSCIWWSSKDYHTDNIVWAPSTDEGFWLPYNFTRISWRGARFFSYATDWYFISESEISNDTSASGFFRLGFWPATD